MFLQYFYILTTGFLLISYFLCFNINNILELDSLQELFVNKSYWWFHLPSNAGNFIPQNRELFDQNENLTFVFMSTYSLQIIPKE